MALREICAAVLSPKNPPFRRANPGWRSGPVPPILRRFPEGIPPARPDLRRFPAAAASRCGPPPLSWQISVFACSSPALRSAVRRYPARAPPPSQAGSARQANDRRTQDRFCGRLPCRMQGNVEDRGTESHTSFPRFISCTKPTPQRGIPAFPGPLRGTKVCSYSGSKLPCPAR